MGKLLQLLPVTRTDAYRSSARSCTAVTEFCERRVPDWHAEARSDSRSTWQTRGSHSLRRCMRKAR